jgi:N-methylhydantoinase A
VSRVIGVDVGGTFTDVISVNDEGRVRIAKVPTTVDDQSGGFLAGLAAVGDTDLGDVRLVCHGTTTGTNAVLERKGAVCGLITTAGFRDTLELGRRTRPQNYGLFGTYEPLIPRVHRLEVEERTDAAGRVVRPLDEGQVREAAATLLRAGVESVVIAFLHSYADPAHEQRAREIVAESWPNAYITTSHEVLAEFREFERLSTAAVNAYIQPMISRYFARLVDLLRDAGYHRELLIMRSNGGVMQETVTSRLPVQTVLSGPAAGVTAAAALCVAAGYGNCISADVGGTSFDVAMILDGVPITSSKRQLAYNVPVQLPMIDIHTIGAGGGSIAELDGTGLLKVGPESAGAHPGPVAYGLGGTRPTLTDAYLVLGRLDPGNMMGRDAGADMEAVRSAVSAHVAEPLGISVEEAAEAIVRIANDRMAAAVRSVSLGRGYDPREFAYFAFGGGGALNAVEIARELSIPTVIVPYRLGITSAIGTLVAPARQNFVQTINRRTGEVAVPELVEIARTLADQGRRLLDEQDLDLVDVEVLLQLELQFEGQTHTVPIPFVGDESWDVLGSRFTKAYAESYGVLPGEGIAHKVVNVRVTVNGMRPPVDLQAMARQEKTADTVDGARLTDRNVCFAGRWVSTQVLRRELLPQGASFAGPAVIEQQDGTTLVDERTTVTVDDHGNLILSLNEVPSG